MRSSHSAAAWHWIVTRGECDVRSQEFGSSSGNILSRTNIIPHIASMNRNEASIARPTIGDGPLNYQVSPIPNRIGRRQYQELPS